MTRMHLGVSIEEEEKRQRQRQVERRTRRGIAEVAGAAADEAEVRYGLAGLKYTVRLADG